MKCFGASYFIVSTKRLVENAVKHNEFSRHNPLELCLEVRDNMVALSNPRLQRQDVPPSAGILGRKFSDAE